MNTFTKTSLTVLLLLQLTSAAQGSDGSIKVWAQKNEELKGDIAFRDSLLARNGITINYYSRENRDLRDQYRKAKAAVRAMCFITTCAVLMAMGTYSTTQPIKCLSVNPTKR